MNKEIVAAISLAARKQAYYALNSAAYFIQQAIEKFHLPLWQKHKPANVLGDSTCQSITAIVGDRVEEEFQRHSPLQQVIKGGAWA